MLERTPIAHRIYAGFGLIGALAVVLAVAAIFAAEQARDDAQAFRVLNERTIAVLELRADVTALQRSVQLFASTGQESLSSDATRRISDLRASFEALEAGTTQPLLARMRTSLDNYERSLGSAIAERDLRYTLVHVEIPKLDRRLETHASPPVDADMARWDTFDDAGRTLQRNLYRYLFDPDQALLVDALARVEAVGRTARTDPERAYAQTLEDYGRAFTRIVQATRSYLYLVGVVMAGEAWEFSHLTRQLRDETLSDIPTIVDGMESLASTVRARTMLVGTLALLGALGLSWYIAQSISGPLRAITQTLDRLAKGEHVDRVPGIERGDEIGVMANAANAFKKADERTASLLDEQRDLTDALQLSQEALTQSNREMEQFVYTVSHDLKTPLVTSMGFIGMMRELVDEGEMELAFSKLDVLERSNRRMSTLIAGLLDLSRVGRLDTDRAIVDPRAVIDEVLEQLGGRLDDAECTVEVDDDLPRILVNPMRFGQVMDNLLSNAIKYGRPAKGPFVVKIGSVDAPPGRVVLTVSDGGPGIPPEHHARVFGLFNRLRNDGDGTGIGLSIVERVMRTSGGAVRVLSDGMDDGCTFELEFEQGAPHA